MVAMRQWSNHENFPGVTGNCDANTFYGEKETFKAYGFKTPVPETPPADQSLNTAIALLKEFQTAHSEQYSSPESAVRGLIGAYNDITRVQEDFRLYKANESERVEQLVKKEADAIRDAFMLDTAEKQKLIDALVTKNLGELPWSLLLSWGFKNFWKAKRG
jgi:hypothetical protein